MYRIQPWLRRFSAVLVLVLLAACGNDETYVAPVDPNLPTINITGPSDGALVSQDNVVVTGVLNDAVTTVSYTVNGGRSWPVEFADDEYAFPLRDS